MEGNLNQFMSLQSEQNDSEERRSIRTPEDSYTIYDDDSDPDGQDSERASDHASSQASRVNPQTIPENGVYKTLNAPRVGHPGPGERHAITGEDNK